MGGGKGVLLDKINETSTMGVNNLGIVTVDNEYLKEIELKLEKTIKENKRLKQDNVNLVQKIDDMGNSKYITALQKIGALEKEIRRLNIDNNILTEKIGKEAKHSERIKGGYDTASKSEVTREVIEELISRGLNKTEIAKQLNVTRPTIYNKLK